ncbi:MAG TPA: AarF/UbiB family protein [Verrucomicrobiae bacterium]|nr:AarF/UbiB family protein [Verrucomicrobiae bacterium]
MKLKLPTIHLKRYKEIAALLWKYGRSDLVRQMGVDELLSPREEVKPTGLAPDELANDLEAMGPTFIKIGQLLSSRSDLIPEVYLKSLARLQDSVKPFSFEEVERIILQELGVRISKAFSKFNPKPIAAASLGQVHFAALRDGRQVIVKIQRPEIRKQIAEDFEVLTQIAEFLDAHTEFGRRYRFLTGLEEFRVTIQKELNYEREAQNLLMLGRNLKDFERIQVPQPVEDFTTRSVLTMDFVQGRKITSLSPLARLDLNGAALADELFRAYLKQIMVDGMFHADPHPGNVFLTDDGHIALIDLGMVGHVAPTLQENLLKLLIAVSEGDNEQAADIIVSISRTDENFNDVQFGRRMGQIITAAQNQSLEKLNVGKSLLDMSKTAIDNGLFVPGELTLLGKTLLQLDEIGKIIDPKFDPYSAVRQNLASLLTQRLKKHASQGTIVNSLLDFKNLFTHLPGRINRILDSVADSELEVKVKAVDTQMLVEGFQKVANRITAGVILAALIMGAALMMRIQTQFTIFGYPGLAILCFLGAAGGGAWLLFTIFFQDEKIKKRKKI